MSADKKLPVKTKNTFKCLTCNDSKEMNQSEINEHMKVHGVNPKKIKGTRQMLSHMDGDKWYSSTYKLSIEGGPELYQYCWSEREKNDPMRF